MRPAAAFGKPFTYLAAAPPPTASTTTVANDIRPPLQQQLQSPVPASVLHTFGSSTSGSGGGVPPTPPVRTSTVTGKQKPPPVPPRGEQTRLTTVPAKRPESSTLAVSAVPSPPPPPLPKTPSPPPLSIEEHTEENQPPPPPPPLQVHALLSSPPAVVTEPEEDLSASALISKFENGCTVKSTTAMTITVASAVDHKPAVFEVDSGTSTLAESTDDDENGGGCGEVNADEDDEDDGAADIWVRTIESPVKNPQKVRHHSDSALKAATVSSWSLVEKRGSLPVDAAVAVDNNINNKKSSPPLANKESTRSSFRSTAGSRCSSPALLAQNTDGRRITAAEALGVVAKPCPRILPSSASLDVACRRQSLSNLTTESRFSTLLSSSVRSSWAPPSGVQTDVESTQSEPSFDYRRKKFTKRCSSADGRNPVHHHHHHHHYHTMSGTRVTAARDPDFGAKRAFIQEKLQAASAKMRVSGMVTPTGLPPTPPPPIAAYQQHNGSGSAGDCGRPPRSSSCNCGQHQATSRPMFVNKRTVSAEELLPSPSPITGTTIADADPFAVVGRPVSSSSSSSAGGGSSGRGSFGRSQRVTFALDQHQQLVVTAPRPASSATAEQGSSSSSSSSSIAKKPFKSNLKVKETAVPELNVLGTSAINTRLPPQHPHPYGLPYKLPAVTADILQVV